MKITATFYYYLARAGNSQEPDLGKVVLSGIVQSLSGVWVCTENLLDRF